MTGRDPLSEVLLELSIPEAGGKGKRKMKGCQKLGRKFKLKLWGIGQAAWYTERNKDEGVVAPSRKV